VESGDDITPTLDQRTLVLVNHQSTADVPMLMTTFNTKQEVLPNVMWIMDKVFMYTNFGIVSCIHRDFFIGSVSAVILIDFNQLLIILKIFLLIKNVIVGTTTKRTRASSVEVAH
jgi:hypothetical protein